MRTFSTRIIFNKLFLALLCWGAILLFWSPNLSIKAADTTKGQLFQQTFTISRNTTPLLHDVFQLLILASNVLLFYLVLNSIDKESVHRRLMWCWIIFGAIVATFCLLVNFSNFENPSYKLNLCGDVTFTARLMLDSVKAAGLGTPHHTSFVLNMVIGISLGMMLAERKLHRKVLLGLLIPLLMTANLLTLTKAGLAGMVAMLHFFVLFFRRLRRHIFRNLLLLYSILILLFTLHLNISKEHRFHDIPRFLYGAGYKGALVNRLKYTWTPGLEEWVKTGLLGLGVGTYTYATISPHAHSLYLSILFDFGIVGVVILAAILFIAAKNLLRMLSYQETYLQTMLLACYGVLLSMGVHAFIDFDYNTPVIWLFFAFYTATFLLTQIELNQTRPEGGSKPRDISHSPRQPDQYGQLFAED